MSMLIDRATSRVTIIASTEGGMEIEEVAAKTPEKILKVSIDPATGADTGLLQMLREIWQFTRDLVNLGFAVGLIIGAVMMIVTADGKWVAEHMKKFIAALILVNFSWFIPRVLFDVSQIATYTVYQIPSLLGADGCTLPPSGDDTASRPCEVVLRYAFFQTNTEKVGTIPDANGLLTHEDGTTGWKCPLRPLVCIQTAPIDSADERILTSTRVIDGLIVNHARLMWLNQINLRDAEVRLAPGTDFFAAMGSLTGILLRIVMVLVIQIAIFFPLMAMVAAFFIRIPVLWVTIAFMPLTALGFIFAGAKEYTDQILKNFLQACFLPVKIAIPFAIGFIMLNAGAQIPPPIGLDNPTALPIFSGIGNLWQLIWMGIALFIIWHYGFEVLKSDKAGFLGKFTDKIQGIGSGLGSFAARIPLSIPLIPTGGRGPSGELERISFGQVTRGLRNIAGETAGSGRLDFRGAFARGASLSAPTTNPTLVKSFTERRELVDTVRLILDPASTSTDPEVARKGLEAALKHIRESGPAEARGRSVREVIDSLIEARPDAFTNPSAVRRLVERRTDILGSTTPTTPPPTTPPPTTPPPTTP
jgi:hypothetical protein